MSSTSVAASRWRYVVKNGMLFENHDAGTQTGSVSVPCSQLVAQLSRAQASPISTSGSVKSFAVTLHDDHMEIRPVSSISDSAQLIIKGKWVTDTKSQASNTSEGLVIEGEDALLGFLVQTTIGAQEDHAKPVDSYRAALLGSQLDHLSELIKTSWWHNLTRSIQTSNAALTKIDMKLLGDDPRPRIYVPEETPEQYEYYLKLAKENPELRLDVRSLPPPPLTNEFIQSLNVKPGLLALAMDEGTDATGNTVLHPVPYIVPGGRFNELYGWDTFFALLGLLEDDLTDLCTAILKNFCFCIQHYGKVFNANRTYYLGRSQPPFLTTMGIEVCQKLGKDHPNTLELAKLTLFASIKEYYTVWTSGDHFDGRTGLSLYHGEGKGFPPECEPGHFDDELSHIAVKHKMSMEDFAKAYNNGSIQDEELDLWLKHDRAGRESGHDTTYRFVGRAAHLATTDLNSLLHKYEIDIAYLLETYFDGTITIPSTWRGSDMPEQEKSSSWTQKAAERRDAMTKYLWSTEVGAFVDYNTVDQVQVPYDNPTAFWPLWAGVATQSQAESTVKNILPKLENYGGLATCTEASRGEISAERPQRQWDYPNGWAPHQMLAWKGLSDYGFIGDAERLIYRWLSMVTKTFTEHNGLVVEKYDVTSEDKSHVVEAEYGNQGSDFDSEVQTGFAWTNASVVYGANMLRTFRKAT